MYTNKENNMTIYEVGDRVIITREALSTSHDYPTGYKHVTLDWNPKMSAYCGKTVTILRAIGHGKYRIKEDGGRWAWCKAFFENNNFVVCNDDDEEMAPPNISRLLGSFRVCS